MSHTPRWCFPPLWLFYSSLFPLTKFEQLQEASPDIHCVIQKCYFFSTCLAWLERSYACAEVCLTISQLTSYPHSSVPAIPFEDLTGSILPLVVLYPMESARDYKSIHCSGYMGCGACTPRVASGNEGEKVKGEGCRLLPRQHSCATHR
jgi:hypothetical protein